MIIGALLTTLLLHPMSYILRTNIYNKPIKMQRYTSWIDHKFYLFMCTGMEDGDENRTLPRLIDRDGLIYHR